MITINFAYFPKKTFIILAFPTKLFFFTNNFHLFHGLY